MVLTNWISATVDSIPEKVQSRNQPNRVNGITEYVDTGKPDCIPQVINGKGDIFKKGKVFVISGPSGVGKSSIRCRLLMDLPHMRYSVSYTTRLPRKGEVAGIDYFFVSRQVFSHMIEEGQFLEYTYYHDNMYGTSRTQLLEMLNKGTDVLLELDSPGALQVKNNMPEAVLIYIYPPSIEDLRRRLVKRGKDSPDTIAKRMAGISDELKNAAYYDFIVTNNSLDKAVSELKAIVMPPE